jgi:putative endonuclease
MEKSSFVYMMASGRYGTLYIGVTSDLVKRVLQHREGVCDGFTKRYKINKLVWYEVHGEIYSAISREKNLKVWRRTWKLDLISAFNPEWRDLYDDLLR